MVVCKKSRRRLQLWCMWTSSVTGDMSEESGKRSSVYLDWEQRELDCDVWAALLFVRHEPCISRHTHWPRGHVILFQSLMPGGAYPHRLSPFSFWHQIPDNKRQTSAVPNVTDRESEEINGLFTEGWGGYGGRGGPVGFRLHNVDGSTVATSQILLYQQKK